MGTCFIKNGAFQRLILRLWTIFVDALNQSDKMSLWSSVILIPKIVTSLSVCSFWSLGALFKERKVAPKRAQICPDLLHPHGYPPHASKRHTARSWGHTRELADILSVRYLPLTIRRNNGRFGGVSLQKLIIYLWILDILSLNSHRKSKNTPPLKANLQIVYRNQCPLN